MCFGMQHSIQINSKAIGQGLPVYVIAEIGCNHKGDMTIAKELIKIAKVKSNKNNELNFNALCNEK